MIFGIWAIALESLRRMFACLGRVMHSFTFPYMKKTVGFKSRWGMFVCWIHMWVGFLARCAQIKNVFISVAIAISRSSTSLNRESVMCAMLVSKLKWKPQKCFELKRKRKLNFPTHIHIKLNRSPTHYSAYWDNKSLPAIIATCSISILIYGILDCCSLLGAIFIWVESQCSFRRNSDRFETMWNWNVFEVSFSVAKPSLLLYSLFAAYAST